MESHPGHVSAEEILTEINALREGDASAGDRLSRALGNPVHLAVVRILGDNAPDTDDVSQDSLLAALDYFQRDAVFQGDPVKLAVTIARNRSIDVLRRRASHPQVDVDTMADWIADSSRSALDDLEQRDLLDILQDALDRMGQSCSQLLRNLYILKKPTEEIRIQLGLKSVHAVYYRRDVCLQEAKKFLQITLHFRSGSNDGQEIGQGEDRRGGK